MVLYHNIMKYKNIEFDAIVATPGVGKSHLCDKYPNTFVDVDEVRLRSKYFVPDNITRKELEQTKWNRPFAIRSVDYVKEMYQQLDNYVEQGKILVCAPHPESIKYLVERKIKFCFIFPKDDMKDEIVRRCKMRGNSAEILMENMNNFEIFQAENKKENKSVVHYIYSKNEYLEDILKKFGCKF